jgi:hypothetical protein
MLTWSIFERRFGGDPGIIGHQIHLDSRPFTVIGVLPNLTLSYGLRYDIDFLPSANDLRIIGKMNPTNDAAQGIAVLLASADPASV